MHFYALTRNDAFDWITNKKDLSHGDPALRELVLDCAQGVGTEAGIEGGNVSSQTNMGPAQQIAEVVVIAMGLAKEALASTNCVVLATKIAVAYSGPAWVLLIHRGCATPCRIRNWHRVCCGAVDVARRFLLFVRQPLAKRHLCLPLS
ncbi:MAG TPA: hypothetical protein QF700_05530 [Prochlorococcus sp.]|nr:hypothetical protein [Prochlorococcus sp.]